MLSEMSLSSPMDYICVILLHGYNGAMNVRPIRDHWLELEGKRVFYRTLPAASADAGVPLLLLHGISCCTGTWEPFLRTLAGRAEAPYVLVPDLPAHGRSEKPDRLLDMEALAGWAACFLERLGVPRAHVMGHSMGGQVALVLAHRRPEQVGKLVLLGPTTGRRHVSTLRNAAGLLADSTREPGSYNRLLTRVFFRMGPRRYFRTIGAMQRDDAFLHAREVAAPTLVLQGSRDAIVPKRVGKSLAGVLPRSEYAVIAGAPHATQFSHPAETAEVVLRFLSDA